MTIDRRDDPRRRRTTARGCSRARARRARDDLVRAALGSRLRRREARSRAGTARARAIAGRHGRHFAAARTWRRGDDHALRVRRRGAASAASVRSTRSARHDVRVERQPGSPARRRVAGQHPRLGRAERCVRRDHRDADGLGHPSRRDGGTPIAGVHVTRGFFDVYRRQPRLGRTFDADEYEGAASITSRQASSGEPVVVLSHRLWQTLGADPQLVGRTVSISKAATGA